MSSRATQARRRPAAGYGAGSGRAGSAGTGSGVIALVLVLFGVLVCYLNPVVNLSTPGGTRRPARSGWRS